MGVPPPESYPYEQPLIQDKWVKNFPGSKTAYTLVRRKHFPGANWEVTKKGQAYFAYNRDEYLPKVHYLIYKTDWQKNISPPPGEDWILPLDYDPNKNMLSDFPVTVGAIRNQDQHPLTWMFPTVQQQQDEVKAAVRKMLQNPEQYSNGRYTTIDIDGVNFTQLGLESDITYIWDERRDIQVQIRRTNIYDFEKPTTEIILDRPLRDFALPNHYSFRPFDLHPESFEYFEHGCAVQMIKTAFTTKYVSGAQKRKPKEREDKQGPEQGNKGEDKQ